jgi:hypothetical protein
MWSITSYYNPARYKRKLKNYRVFRAKLTTPLVAVELSFDGHFELTKDDADVLIQISGGALLWQKERLLNLAIKYVPADISTIAWLDCDVMFERPDWMHETHKRLKTAHVVQPFSEVLDLNQMDQEIPVLHGDTPRSVKGLVSLVSEKTRLDAASLLATQALSVTTRVWGSGLAWAARREILEKYGLYDAMIAGAGDRAMAYAMFGQFDALMKKYNFNGSRRTHYLAWACPFYEAVGERVDHLAGRLYHLWHGDIVNRNYTARHQKLAECNFDPNADIAIGPNGVWHWARSRPDLEEFFLSYFKSRAEDG